MFSTNYTIFTNKKKSNDSRKCTWIAKSNVCEVKIIFCYMTRNNEIS